ncbi:MAG: response regulator transcription factor [Verrucomicrobiota bacterium]
MQALRELQNNSARSRKRIRILLADDHSVVREGLKRLVEAADGFEVVAEADTGVQAIELTLATRPDIVVMDVSMPELDGCQAALEIKRRAPNVKVLALTVFEDEEHLRALLQAGAAGYVLKRSAGEELVHALRAVDLGGVYLDPRIAGKALTDRATSRGEPPSALLSERETSVLRLIAEGYGNKEIASRIGISAKTVETYKARAMKKLRLRNRVDIVRFANRAGWTVS